MASVTFTGPYGDNIWHKGPTLKTSGTLTASRSNSTISGSISCSSWFTYSGTYGYPVYIKLLYNGNEVGSWTTASGGSWSFSTNFSFTSNDAGTLSVVYVCGQSGGCSKGYNWNTMSGTLYIEAYNPYTPPTGPTYCKLDKTSLKPDQSISVSWKGETGGTPGINHFQVEMSQWRGGTQIRNYTRVSGPIYYASSGYNPCTWTATLSSLTNYDSSSDKVQIRPR